MLKLKNYTQEDLEAALTHLHGVSEPDRLLEELSGLIHDELKRRKQPLLRRHSDTGLLKRPGKVIRGPL